MSFPSLPTLGLRRTLLISTPLLLSLPIRRLHCDAPDPLAAQAGSSARSSSSSSSGFQQKTLHKPLALQSGFLNSKMVRQVSMGSVLGVLGGLGVSVFSKPLALLIGLAVVLVQLLESRGIHLVPYSYLQTRFKQTNMRSLVQSNPAFKFSFGITFALAAFAHF